MNEKVDQFEQVEQGKRPLLALEEFTRIESSGHAHPRYQNFHLFFVDSKYNFQRSENASLLEKLRQENPELESLLTQELTKGFNEHNISEVRKRVEPQLYQAYLILHKYVEDDDKELFT